jgi:lecithin:retinol acyltransferase
MEILEPGTVVSVQIGLIRHYGIASDRYDSGGSLVISSSKAAGLVIEEPLICFSHGKRIQTHGFPSDLMPWQVVSRARSVLGSRYNLRDSNCEHFVRWVHGLKPESPQLKRAMLVGGILAGIGAVALLWPSNSA